MRFLVLLGLLAQAGVLAAEPKLLMEDPVRVTATLEQGDVALDAIFHIGPDQRVKSLYLNDDIAGYLTWQAPYLRVRSTSGGNCWDCDGEAIFKIEAGKLVRLGDINTDYRRDTLPAQAPGHFVTEYSKLELQAGFCHACSPSFLIALIDRAGHLDIDADGTWALNRNLWLREELKPPEALAASDMEGLRDLVSAAALARYCGRETELLDLQARWEPFLDEDSRTRMADALALVKPLEPVAAWNAMAPY